MENHETTKQRFRLLIVIAAIAIVTGMALLLVEMKTQSAGFFQQAGQEELPLTLDERFEYRIAHSDSDSDKAVDYTSRIEALYQYPELPTGCECVASTIVLRSYGFDIDKTELWDNYLQFSDGTVAFEIDSFSYDFAVPPAVQNAINDYLADQESELRAFDLTDTSFKDLYQYIDQGYPIILWSTSSMQWPTAPVYHEGYRLYYPEHCVVLYGYDLENNVALVSDPQDGLVERDLDSFHGLYDACGQMALIIM